MEIHATQNIHVNDCSSYSFDENLEPNVKHVNYWKYMIVKKSGKILNLKYFHFECKNFEHEISKKNTQI